MAPVCKAVDADPLAFMTFQAERPDRQAACSMFCHPSHVILAAGMHLFSASGFLYVAGTMKEHECLFTPSAVTFVLQNGLTSHNAPASDNITAEQIICGLLLPSQQKLEPLFCSDIKVLDT